MSKRDVLTGAIPSVLFRRGLPATAAAAAAAGAGAVFPAGTSSAGVLSAALGTALGGSAEGKDAFDDESAARRFGLVEFDSAELDYSFRHPRGKP